MPHETTEKTEKSMPMQQRVLRSAALSTWTVVGFFLANFLVGLIVTMLFQVHIISPDVVLNNSVFMTSLTAAVFVLTFVIVVGTPYAFRGSRTTKQELGLTRFPDWYDLFWAPVSFVVYSLLAGILLMIVTSILPGFDADEVQDIGFENLAAYYEYILAFITLVIIAPVAEEVLFRGYLYGKLRKYMPMVGAVLLSATLFALLHLNFGTDAESGEFVVSQWNVVLGILPLGIVLAVLREKTGSVWASILLHALKNGVAFYLLFINPSILNTIGR